MTSVYEFELSDLPAGRYRFEETLAPDGYIILTKYTYFRIKSEDRKVELTNEEGTRINNNSQASITNKAGVYTITVKNYPGSALPSTGGPGTGLFTLGGAGLILTSLFLSCRRLIRRRRKETDPLSLR